MRTTACFPVALTLLASILPSPANELKVLSFPAADPPVFQWQLAPLAEPKGGQKFAASAFIHPLTTPAGFLCTDIQPADHLHHLGLWWPWKYVEVRGKKYVTWELQNGEGMHRAKSAKIISQTAQRGEFEMINETLIKPKGSSPRPVIEETARIVVERRDAATVLDVSLTQKPVGDQPVTIAKNHYSGFSWRGPASWNKDNSTLLSSEGKGRDNANGTPARWLIASGATTTGQASVLLMSDAEHLSGAPESLRVWGAEQHDGAPFVNFNPVARKAIPLDDKHPAVAKRKYRVIAADRTITKEEAEAEWKQWTGR